MGVVLIARMAHGMYKKKIIFMAQMLKNFNRILFACDIAYQVEVPKTTQMPHQGLGVVIGPGCVIGENCTIYQNVTLGAKHNGGKATFPIIGNNVMIGCGSVLLGEIKVGNNVSIGANAVCLKNIDDDMVVAGNPATNIKKDMKGEKL